MTEIQLTNGLAKLIFYFWCQSSCITYIFSQQKSLGESQPYRQKITGFHQKGSSNTYWISTRWQQDVLLPPNVNKPSFRTMYKSHFSQIRGEYSLYGDQGTCRPLGNSGPQCTQAPGLTSVDHAYPKPNGLSQGPIHGRAYCGPCLAS